MSDNLWDFYGGVAEKSLPSTMTPPSQWFGEEWQWTDVVLGIEGSALRPSSAIRAVGIALAVQCADVIARDIAKAGMTLWARRARKWEAVEPGDHWFARMLARRPNMVQTWGLFWRTVVLQLKLVQNAYLAKRINRQGDVLELMPLLPARVRQRVSTGGRLFYEVNAATEFERAWLGDDFVILPADQVIHLRERSLNGITGLSNTELGAPLFDLVDAIASYQTNLFGNDGKQPLVFETDQAFANSEMADNAFRRLKEQLTERTRKARAVGDPILLEAGLKAKSIAVNARDSMTPESYNQVVSAVCRLMGVPPHKIFHYESVKYENQSAADNQYANDCLVPTALLIEESMRNGLLPLDEWDTLWPEFEREIMVAGDVKAMTERVKVAMQTGLMTVNEGRERFGLQPIPGGDVRLMPVAMAMVDDDGEIIAQGADGQPNNDGETEAPRQPGDDEA